MRGESAHRRHVTAHHHCHPASTHMRVAASETDAMAPPALQCAEAIGLRAGLPKGSQSNQICFRLHCQPNNEQTKCAFGCTADRTTKHPNLPPLCSNTPQPGQTQPTESLPNANTKCFLKFQNTSCKTKGRLVLCVVVALTEDLLYEL